MQDVNGQNFISFCPALKEKEQKALKRNEIKKNKKHTGSPNGAVSDNAILMPVTNFVPEKSLHIN